MKHNLVIIGFGGMGSWHHTRLTRDCNRFAVTGVYDVRPQACEKAGALGLAVYNTFEQVLHDSAVEAILIATPNDSHKDYAIRALYAGKHVICEKPVAMNAEELLQIMEAEQSSSALFTIHQNRRWDTDFAVAQEIVRSGSIGTPYFIESRVQGSRGSMHGWRSYRQNGGGMLLDWGVHILDQALQIIDSPVVCAEGHLQHVFSQEVEDNIKLFLRFENGVSFLAEMSTNCFLPLPRWHISCTGGTARIDDWDGHGTIMTLREDGPMQWDEDIVYTAAGPTRTMAPRPAHTVQEHALPQIASDSVDFYENVADAIEGKAELTVTSAQALRVMRLIDLIFRSDATHTCIACNL